MPSMTVKKTRTSRQLCLKATPGGGRLPLVTRGSGLFVSTTRPASERLIKRPCRRGEEAGRGSGFTDQKRHSPSALHSLSVAVAGRSNGRIGATDLSL